MGPRPPSTFSHLMADHFLPPQAYTREMLAQAYDWLEQQPNEVKAQAKNADLLVSLYLHAKKKHTQFRSQRNTQTSSVKQFKSELQELSEDLKQFDSVEESTSTSTVEPALSNPVENINPVKTVKPPPLPKEFSFSETTTSEPQGTSIEVQKERLRVTTPQTRPGAKLPLDDRSRQAILHVQSALNLSSETEALRVLIQLGYAQAKNILP